MARRLVHRPRTTRPRPTTGLQPGAVGLFGGADELDCVRHARVRRHPVEQRSLAEVLRCVEHVVGQPEGVDGWVPRGHRFARRQAAEESALR